MPPRPAAPSRNTPTHVGKTGIWHCPCSGKRKHPHARGEDLKPSGIRAGHGETPPRTWGRLRPPRSRLVTGGNTPTHVGKAEQCAAMPTYSEKHPHARGEDAGHSMMYPIDVETPPRTWGRQKRTYSAAHAGRNTPTHVGKTVSPEAGRTGKRKHPHARGEDSKKVAESRKKLETPPRTWGRLNDAAGPYAGQGNTPTHVGKTDPTSAPSRRTRKHPHARGEDRPRAILLVRSRETPPRTWGRLSVLALEVCRLGNTPTHVGKTSLTCTYPTSAQKHPHARGEDPRRADGIAH